MAWCRKLLQSVNRKKTLDEDIMETPLRRCLTTVDLTLWGIGHMVGAGIFVLTGTVTKDIAGPGVILSYLFAGIAAVLAALCYAEFGARVPKAGSAYTYTYLTMGEVWAFLIGWNIILEHSLAAASVARAWSASLDAIFNGVIRNGTLTYIGRLNSPWMGEYPDFVALGIVLVIMAFVAYGAKTSANLNNLFTVFNMVVILMIVFIGLYLSDAQNWSSQHGGFLPYGFSGVLSGAATCFFAYIGFEGIAIAGEEAKDPAKSIPVATFIAMGVASSLYIAASASLTLMIPYDQVDVSAPFPHAFAHHGLMWVKVAIAVGSLFGITTTLLGSLFTLPRAVYAMSADGLFFRCFAYINGRTQTPLLSILVFGSVTGVLTLLIDMETLVEFLSIGTLSSFTIVAAAVLVLRYQPADNCQFELRPEESVEFEDSDKKQLMASSQSHNDIGKLKAGFSNVPILRNIESPWLPTVAIVTGIISMALFALVLVLGIQYVERATWWSIIFLIVFGLVTCLCFVLLVLHEQNTSFLTFQMPLVPLLPYLSIFLNMLLMLKLNVLTWVRMAVWVTVGFIIYFLYGVHHSSENKPLSQSKAVITYTGDDKTRLSETVHSQQPMEDVLSPQGGGDNPVYVHN